MPGYSTILSSSRFLSQRIILIQESRNQFIKLKTTFMKRIKNLAAIAAIMFFVSACQKDARLSQPENDAASGTAGSVSSKTGSVSNKNSENVAGHVYTLSNQVSGNAVMEYSRASDGSLSFMASHSAGGTGTGGGLGNQGALVLSDDGTILLAVNSGSNTISSFKIDNTGLNLASTVASGGMRPVSITKHDNMVFVLNAGGNGNISGFWISNSGILLPIAGSTRPLSSNSAGAAQIEFVNDGKVVVVTEKATNKIITYKVNGAGIPGMMHSITSSNPTPFGFAAGKENNIFVSEAVGGAPGASTLSSYRVSDNGMIVLVDGPVGANQSAACWVAITNNGKYAYTTNTNSDNLSTFAINNAGSISVNTAISATTQAGPIDAALSNNSKFLYILNGGGHSISVFAVANDGSLSSVQTVPGLPVGANGLAAR